MQLGSEGMRMLDDKTLELLELRADMNNVPRLGCEDNRGFFNGSQINIAPAVEHASGAGVLAESLGSAGEAHTDDGDERGLTSRAMERGLYFLQMWNGEFDGEVGNLVTLADCLGCSLENASTAMLRGGCRRTW